MSSNINFRIFRRNSKNLILLWNSASLPDDAADSVAVLLVDGGGNEGPLSFSRFTPENPEKFAKDVDGIVIPHGPNKMDPTKSCTVKVIFGDGDEGFEVVKTVLPANSAPEAPERDLSSPKAIHMYAMDYRTKTWVPFPVNPEHLGND